MKDVVLGCISGYEWDNVKLWANSLVQSGFDGMKAVIVYNGSFELVEKLDSLGFQVVVFNKDEAARRYTFPIQGPEIVVTRFYHQWLFLSQLQAKDYRYVVATDVKDVVFQRNPSKFIDTFYDPDCYFTNERPKLLVGSEGLDYEDEPWGYDNMEQAFGPYFQQYMAKNEIYNAGTMAGEFDTFKDFCLQVFLVSQGNRIHNPDQAAVNVLLTLEPWKSFTRFDRNTWAAQMGTIGDPSKPDLIGKAQWAWELKDGMVYDFCNDEPFVLVHQYDRNPELNALMHSKYGG